MVFILHRHSWFKRRQKKMVVVLLGMLLIILIYSRLGGTVDIVTNYLATDS